jgi:hypothetical protein
MKTTARVVAVAMIVGAMTLLAATYEELDTSVGAVNDFWSCTNHVNPVITCSTNAIAGTFNTQTRFDLDTAAQNPFESRYMFLVMTDPIRLRVQEPIGLTIFLR